MGTNGCTKEELKAQNRAARRRTRRGHSKGHRGGNGQLPATKKVPKKAVRKPAPKKRKANGPHRGR